MKGRRVARELALQALYELDQSSHAVSDVIAARAEAYYRGVAEAAADEAQRVAMHRLLAGVDLRSAGEGPWRALATEDGLAARLAVSPTALAQALGLLVRHGRLVDYGLAIVRGVLAHLEAIDRVIRGIAPEWPVAQMAPVDRNTLRIALWEIGSQAVPMRVAINEAVELARRYSGEGARRMVNGALGAFTKRTGDLVLPAYGPPNGPSTLEAELPADPIEDSATGQGAVTPDPEAEMAGMDLSVLGAEPDEDWPLAPLADLHDVEPRD